MIKNIREEICRRTESLIASYLICFGTLTLFLYGLFQLPFATTPFQLPEVLAEHYATQTYPIQKDKIIFLLSLLSLPGLSLLAILASHQWIKTTTRKHITFIATCLFLPVILLTFGTSDVFSQPSQHIAGHNLLLLGATLLATGILFAPLPKSPASTPITVLLVIATILLTVLSYKIASIYSVTNELAWNFDFETLYFDTTQVMGGKTLLANIPSLYGLFPEILYPLYKLIGLSIVHFTFSMAILEIGLYIFLFLTLLKLMKSRLLILLCMVTLCILLNSAWQLTNLHTFEPYYQYTPIRVFFPAIATLMFSLLVTRKQITKKFIVGFSLLGSLAILWNMDSGIPIMGTLLLYLASFLFFPTQQTTRGSATQLLILILGVALASIAFFFGYLYWKSGYTNLHFTWLLKYQKIYYDTNFMALPIQYAPSPWQIFYGVYLFGIVAALQSWVLKKRRPITDMIFCLSLLGLGLFTYFIGRAHYLNLLHVCWPAIMIAFLFCDQLLRLTKNALLPKRYAIYCLPLLLFSIILSAEFIYNLPALTKQGLQQWEVMRTHPTTPYTENIDFIKQYAPNEKRTLILGPLEAVYYGELGRISPIQSTSYLELILKSDTETYQRDLANYSGEHLFVQLNTNNHIPLYLQNSLTHYIIIKISQHHMAYLVKVSKKG